MIKLLASVFALCFLLLPLTSWSQVVIEDDGVSISMDELEQLVSRWTPQMREAAAVDMGDRLELLNVSLVAKKIAHEADKLTPETDPDAYWDYVLKIRTAKQEFVLRRFMDNLEVPDMTELSKERYESTKDRIAMVPQVRLSSHILFKCGLGECDRAELRPKVEKVIAELEAGADFTEMVHKYSGDPGTKAKDGKFDRWIKLDTPGVSPPYVRGLFDIEEIGGYSEMVETTFGIHILRLDGIKESEYLPYAQVKDQIIQSLEQEYRILSAKAFNQSFLISDEAYIDGEAMENLFNQYKPAQ